MVWKAADAKNRFSEVLDKAETEGPQVVRRRGREYVIVTKDVWNEPRSASGDFIEHLLNAPKVDEFEFKRNRTPMREVDF